MPDTKAPESQQGSLRCACGCRQDIHQFGKGYCYDACGCNAYRAVGAPTPTQVIGDEMASKRATKSKRTSDKAKAAAPLKGTKRSIKRYASATEVWGAVKLGGERTGQYQGHNDISLAEEGIGVECKQRPLAKWIAEAHAQAAGPARRKGWMPMVLLVDKPGAGGNKRRDAWIIIHADDWDTLKERVQDDRD